MKNLIAQVTTQILTDVLTEAGARIVHGQNDAENGQIWILASLLDSLHEVENFSNSLQSEVLTLDGDENLFCSHEGAGHEQANAGGAVEDDQIEGGIQTQGIESGTDVAKRVVHSGEIHFGPGEVEFGSENLKVGVTGRLQHIEGTGLAEENGVEAFAGHVLQAEATGGIGLGIKIDEEDPATCFGRSRGEVNGGGGLADPALLINDSHDAHTQGKRRSGELSSGFPEWFT